MSGCSACETVDSDPTLSPLLPGMSGGGKKVRKARKAATPKKSAPKKHGGSFLGDLGQLAIPLGLIAAKEGVQYLKSSKTKASTTSKASRTKKSPQRRASFGGNPELYASMAPSMVPSMAPSTAPESVLTPPPAPSDSLASMPSPNSSSTPPLVGGAVRSAAIASEFRKMAGEITEFLKKRKAKAASKPKKPTKPKAKKGGADVDCEAGKKPKSKKKC